MSVSRAVAFPFPFESEGLVGVLEGLFCVGVVRVSGSTAASVSRAVAFPFPFESEVLVVVLNIFHGSCV